MQGLVQALHAAGTADGIDATALAAAASAGVRPGEIEALAVNASPCGGCRQWFHEFRIERVIYRQADGGVAVTTPDELLPDTFEL